MPPARRARARWRRPCHAPSGAGHGRPAGPARSRVIVTLSGQCRTTTACATHGSASTRAATLSGSTSMSGGCIESPAACSTAWAPVCGRAPHRRMAERQERRVQRQQRHAHRHQDRHCAHHPPQPATTLLPEARPPVAATPGDGPPTPGPTRVLAGFRIGTPSGVSGPFSSGPATSSSPTPRAPASRSPTSGTPGPRRPRHDSPPRVEVDVEGLSGSAARGPGVAHTDGRGPENPTMRTSGTRATPVRAAHLGSDVLHEPPHVVGGPAPVGLDEIGVLRRHLGRSHAQPLEPRRLHQAAGGVTCGVHEHRAGVGTPGLVGPAPAHDVRHGPLGRGAVPRPQGELGPEHHLARTSSADVR